MNFRESENNLCLIKYQKRMHRKKPQILEEKYKFSKKSLLLLILKLLRF